MRWRGSAALVPVAAVWLALAAAPAGAIPLVSVDLDPSSPGVQAERTVALGSLVAIEIAIADVEIALPLHAFELDLHFDPAVAAARSVADGGFLGSPLFLVESDLAAPDVNFAETRVGSGGVSGGGRLLLLEFEAVGLGTSALDLLNVILSAPDGEPIADFTLAHGSLVVVPEPVTLALALLALAGACLARERAAS